jgi:hypothetical protein
VHQLVSIILIGAILSTLEQIQTLSNPSRSAKTKIKNHMAHGSEVSMKPIGSLSMQKDNEVI